MKIAWRYLGCSLAVVLALAAGLANRALFQAYLVEPAARILWLASRTFMAVDQTLYWTVLILAVLIVALLMASAGQAAPLRTSYGRAPRPADRLAYWDSLLAAASEDEDARRRLQTELETLAQSVEWGMEDREAPQEMALPPVQPRLYRLVKAALRSPLLNRLTGARSPWLDESLLHRVTPILQSIEKKMEIKHEPSTGDHAGN